MNQSLVHLLHQTSLPGMVLQEVLIHCANNKVLFFYLMNTNRNTVIYIENYIKEIYFHLVVENSQAICVSF